LFWALSKVREILVKGNVYRFESRIPRGIYVTLRVLTVLLQVFLALLPNMFAPTDEVVFVFENSI
jgi:hypothetical protein